MQISIIHCERFNQQGQQGWQEPGSHNCSSSPQPTIQPPDSPTPLKTHREPLDVLVLTPSTWPSSQSSEEAIVRANVGVTSVYMGVVAL